MRVASRKLVQQKAESERREERPGLRLRKSKK